MKQTNKTVNGNTFALQRLINTYNNMVNSYKEDNKPWLCCRISSDGHYQGGITIWDKNRAPWWDKPICKGVPVIIAEDILNYMIAHIN